MKTVEETIDALVDKFGMRSCEPGVNQLLRDAITEALDTVDDKHLASELRHAGDDRDGWYAKYSAATQELTDLRFAAEGFQAIAAKEAGRLDWIEEHEAIITKPLSPEIAGKGTKWSVWATKPNIISAEEFGLRAAIDDAIAKDQPCPTA